MALIITLVVKEEAKEAAELEATELLLVQILLVQEILLKARFYFLREQHIQLL